MACSLLARSFRIGVAACALAAFLLMCARMAHAEGAAVQGGGALVSAQLRGKLELEFSSVCEPPAPIDAILDMSFEGQLDLDLGRAGSCEFRILAQPDTRSGETYGYLAAEVSAQPGAGLEFELSARGGRSSDSESPGGRSGDCMSSSVAAVADWESRDGVLYLKGSYEESAWAYPYRPARDRVMHEVSGRLDIAPRPSAMLRIEGDVTRNEYRVADRNTSLTRIVSLEASHGWDAGAGVEIRLESRDRRYPYSPHKSFIQVSGEASASLDLSGGLSLDSLVSLVRRSYPSVPADDVLEREIVLGVSSQASGQGAFAVKAALFGRSVPGSPRKAYALARLKAEYTLCASDELTVSAELALEGKRYADPAASSGDYGETAIECKVSRELAPDLDVKCEIGLTRREYPLRASASTNTVKSSVALVYRI